MLLLLLTSTRALLFLLLGIHYAAAFSFSSIFKGVAQQENDINRILMISFDGLGDLYLDEFLEKNPNSNFQAIINEGVRAEYLQPSYPTATFPNHYTLVTGLYPESHGIVGNDIYDPYYDRKIALQGGPGSGEKKWWDQAEPLWLTARNEGLKTGTLFWVGSEANNNTADVWLPFSATYPFWDRSNDVVNWMKKLKMDLSFLYFDEPDQTGHNFGSSSEQYKNKIKDMDDLLGDLIRKLKHEDLYETTNIVIVSDHGMIDLKPDNALLIQDYLDITKVDKNKSIYGITANIHPIAGSEQYVYNQLKTVPHMDVYWRDQVPAEFHYRNNARIAPIVVVAQEGYRLLDAKPSRNGGHHGYNNSLPAMRGIFIARGPNFKEKKTLPPFLNVNVYSLICELAQIKCHANNGTVQTFKNVLQNTPISSVATPRSGNCNTHSILLFTIFLVSALF